MNRKYDDITISRQCVLVSGLQNCVGRTGPLQRSALVLWSACLEARVCQALSDDLTGSQEDIIDVRASLLALLVAD